MTQTQHEWRLDAINPDHIVRCDACRRARWFNTPAERDRLLKAQHQREAK